MDLFIEKYTAEYGPSPRVKSQVALLDIGGCYRAPSTDGQTEAQHGSLSVLPQFGRWRLREGRHTALLQERGPCGWVAAESMGNRALPPIPPPPLPATASGR